MVQAATRMNRAILVASMHHAGLLQVTSALACLPSPHAAGGGIWVNPSEGKGGAPGSRGFHGNQGGLREADRRRHCHAQEGRGFVAPTDLGEDVQEVISNQRTMLTSW